MRGPFSYILHWSITICCWAAIVAGAVLIGVRLGPLYAYAAWAGVSLVLCAVGAALIRSQPLSTPTMAGWVGSQVVRYGFRASQGRLVMAALISLCVWCVVGFAAVWVMHGWPDMLRLAMGVSWCVDALALMYIWGIVLRNRPHEAAPGNTGSLSALSRVPGSLAKMMLLLAAVVVASVVLWFGVGTRELRLVAVLVAAAPVLIVAGGYGVVFLLFMTLGKNVRWN